MERTLLKEVNKTNIEARLNTRKVKPVVYPNFFDLKKVETLEFETLVGEKGVPVMADVISFDAKAPIKTRKTIEKLSGEIPKIAVKRFMKESDVLKYRRLRYDVRGRSDLQSLLDLVFSDLDFCYNGVRFRMEWLAMQAMSKGAITLTSQNNGEGMYLEEAVDYQIPTTNKSGVSVSWATTASSKPLENFQTVKETAMENGINLRYAIMRTSQFNQIKNSADTIAKVKAYVNGSGKLSITKRAINEYLLEEGLPQIVTVDPMVTHESKKGTKTVVNAWEEHRVAFVEDLKVGSLQHAPLAAEGDANLAKKVQMVKRDYTLITKWSEQEPYSEWTKAEANAFPVINDPDAMYLLRTNNASW